MALHAARLIGPSLIKHMDDLEEDPHDPGNLDDNSADPDDAEEDMLVPEVESENYE